MKKIKNIEFKIKQGLIKQDGSFEKSATTIDFIEYALDIPPQGGFTPKDLKDRGRIQDVLDSYKSNDLNFEDADFENLRQIVTLSRWGIRNKDILKFISQFD